MAIGEAVANKFNEMGGLTSIRVWLLVFLSLWASWVFMREKGCIRKKSVKDKHIFITGAGSGIGRDLARKFAELGANVTISDINEKGLAETQQMIKEETKRSNNTCAVKLDVSNRSNITEVFKKAKECFGVVDILINNAGIVQNKLFKDMNEGLASKTMVVNAESHFWTCGEVIEDMMARNNGKGEGQIVAIASLAGLAGAPMVTDYCTSKAAAYMFNEALRIEMKASGYNIVCTNICPYFINTGMFEGVSTSLLAPILTQEYVVKRTIQAILQEENEVIIPWHLGQLVHFLKAIFPSAVPDYINYVLGGWECMKTCTGRQGASAPINQLKVGQK